MSFLSRIEAIHAEHEARIRSADSYRHISLQQVYADFKVYYGMDPAAEISENEIKNIGRLIGQINNVPQFVVAITETAEALAQPIQQ